MVINESETVVKKVIEVSVPIAHAFDVFTRRIDLWWPRSHHIGKAEMKEAVLEGQDGARWYERGVDGSECTWGRVLVWSPPRHVALSWQIDVQWQFEPNPDKASRIDVRFSAIDGVRTRVELEHSLLDRHGTGWEKMKEAIASQGGWQAMLDAFGVKAVDAAA